MRSDRLAVSLATLALVIAIVGAALASRPSTADFIVETTSPGAGFTTLDPDPPATFAAPESRPAGAVRLTWTASPTEAIRSETTYSVHRSPAGAGTWTELVDGLTGLTYTDTPPTDGSYDYKVRTDVSTFYAESAERAGLSDRVDPGITGSFAPAANANGWNDEDVTVTFVCSDGGSGVASCTSPVTVSADGTTVVGGDAADDAGNTASTSVTVKVDKTAPEAVSGLSSASGPLLGAATVEVSWGAATDATSGVDLYTIRWTSGGSCPAPSAAAYPSSATTTGTSYSIPGALLTSYCAYVITHDRAGNQTASAATGPTAAR